MVIIFRVIVLGNELPFFISKLKAFPTDKTAHTTTFKIPVARHWLGLGPLRWFNLVTKPLQVSALLTELTC